MTINGIEISSLRPVRTPSGGSALNKDGRLVLIGEADGAPVKVYGAASPEHALFIQALSEDPQLSSVFPRVLTVLGPVVVAEWVIGEEDHDPGVARLVGIQLRFHGTPLDALPRSGFDYWHDYLRPRFALAANFFGERALLDRVLPPVDERWDSSPAVLMQPDLTPANVVRDRLGGLRIVDTGDLSVGGIPMLDVLNTARSLSPGRGSRHVEEYLDRAGLRLTPQETTILNHAWLARAVGAAYVAGDIAGARILIERHRLGHSVIPANLGGLSGGGPGSH